MNWSATDNPPSGGMIPIPRLAQLLRERNIQPRGFYDIGACDGAESKAFLAEFPSCTAVAVEGLLENVARWLSPPPPGILVFPLVLAGRVTACAFYVQERNGLHSIYNREGFAGQPRSVVTTTLDSFRFAYGSILPPPDVLKIDVEGAAWDVLRGAGATLELVQVVQVETETVPYFSGQPALHEQVSMLLTRAKFLCVQEERASIPPGEQLESVWVRQ